MTRKSTFENLRKVEEVRFRVGEFGGGSMQAFVFAWQSRTRLRGAKP